MLGRQGTYPGQLRTTPGDPATTRLGPDLGRLRLLSRLRSARVPSRRPDAARPDGLRPVPALLVRDAGVDARRVCHRPDRVHRRRTDADRPVRALVGQHPPGLGRGSRRVGGDPRRAAHRGHHVVRRREAWAAPDRRRGPAVLGRRTQATAAVGSYSAGMDAAGSTAGWLGTAAAGIAATLRQRSPTRTVPGTTTRAFIPRNRRARPSRELTKRIASSPNRATNFLHPVCGGAVTSRTASPIASRMPTGRFSWLRSRST